MLQLNRSQATNTNAVYPDVTATAGITSVLLDFTQSINQNTVLGITASLANTVNSLNPWLVIQLTGSAVPTASGQYDVNIYEWNFVGTGSVQWINASSSFVASTLTWGGTGAITRQTLLSTERAFISGSNEYSTTQYLSPTSSYTYTYNYP